MAPALTEASDPQTFHVAARHHSSGRPGQTPPARTTSPPAAHLPLQYGGLKEPHACTDAHLAAALANGPRRTPHLLPPPSPTGAGGLACEREACDPPPRPHPAHTTMDPQPGQPPHAEADQNPQERSEAAAMGQDTAPAQDTMAPHNSPRPPPQDGEILALIGRDFANMNEIIETLSRLADYSEVLTAALSIPGETPAVAAPPITEAPVPREERARVLVEELGRRQWLLERRQARLQRRLRRVTARGLSATVSGQLRDLLGHAHVCFALQREEAASTPATATNTAAAIAPTASVVPSPDDGVTPPTPPEVGMDTFQADSMRTMSTSALVNLVRRVEASQGLARLAAASTGSGRTQPSEPATALPDDTRAEVGAVVGEMHAAAHAHTHHDSDATETSSGGESCDEMEGFTDVHSNYCPVRERAFYRYHKARAWVASRWTWLQAQIADLEYRILQQHKIYAHVRNTKGVVQVEEGSRWRGPTLRDPAHVDVHDPALTCLAAPVTRTALNGYHNRGEEGVGGGTDTTFVSARSQGVRAVKRRRLVRAGAGLCASLRRGGGGGRIPAVQCKCVPPLTCVLCMRLQGPAPPATPPDPHTQPAAERFARVDPTYHPVLSQPADVSLSERFDGMLKTTDWQRQMLTAKTLHPLPVTRTHRDAPHTEKKKKKDKDRKKEYKKHKKEGKGRITLKLKRSLFTGELIRDGDFKRKKVPSQDPILTMKKVRVEDEDDTSSMYGSSLHSSPSASPAPLDRSSLRRHTSSSSSSQKNKQSTSSNSYDIDNIVIPYSMAAATRLEKLEYKEIPTPKWRVVPLIPNNIHRPSQANESEEDISEESIIARHGRSEELERKKFQQYSHTRSSRSRRTDSSGTNTPDHPLSPRPPDPASDTISPLATPPTTPLAASEDSNQSSSLSTIPPTPTAPPSTPTLTSISLTSTLTSQTGLVSSSQTATQPTTTLATMIPHHPLLLHNSHQQLSISMSGSVQVGSGAPSLAALVGSRRHRTLSTSSTTATTKPRTLPGADEVHTDRLEVCHC